MFITYLLTNHEVVIKILAMEDSERLIKDIRKFVKRTKISQINIPTSNREFLIDKNSMSFFESKSIIKQVEEINTIKKRFDFCLVSSWSTARIAYITNMKYIIYFVGHDIRIPPFVKHSKLSYFNEPVNKLNFIERYFYKKVLDNAIACVTGSEELFNCLKKYRKDGIRIDRTIVDTSIFNPLIKPVNLTKIKFTFFSPQRIGIEKGTDVLWKALLLCKSDFDVIQVEWIDEKSLEAKKSSEELLKNKPSQVKLIPLIKQDDIPKYYTFADAVLGEMRTGHVNMIEREAAMCNKPVISYNDPKWKYLIDGKEITSPFLPISQDPEIVAKIIDKIVESEEFRKELAEKEHDFIKELSDPIKTANDWDNLFETLHDKFGIIKKQDSIFISKLKLVFFLLGRVLHFNSSSNRLP